MNVDFATVQWARRMTAALASLFNDDDDNDDKLAAIESLEGLSPDDKRKLSQLVEKLGVLPQNIGGLSPLQLQVILQNLHTKDLVSMAANKGGIFVEFTGGGFEYERFLVRADGKMPNNRYESKKAT